MKFAPFGAHTRKTPMYAHVHLLNGLKEPLTYKIPDGWDTTSLWAAVVTVPLQNRLEKALVTDIVEYLPATATYKVRELIAREPFPTDHHFGPFVKALSDYYILPQKLFFQRLKSCLRQPSPEGQTEGSPPHSTNASHVHQVRLTPEQLYIVNELTPVVKQGGYTPAVIQGVTGSGKTEVYKQLIHTAITEGKSAILLLPEISLALRFAHLLREAFKTDIALFSFHSATSALEKKTLWAHLVQNRPVLVIGVHLPALLPISNLGLIIVDEEHEVGYQEKKHPKLNSKEIAIIRAQQYDIPIILGSATPSIQSLYNVQIKGWKLFTLTKRFAGAFPEIQLVSLKGRDKRKNFWISRELEQAIATRLNRREQTIIFINRRGHSFFVQCAGCGFIFSCPHCSVSLTLHQSSTQSGILRCHYCDHKELEPTACPTCGPKASLLKKGIGTQQVVSVLEKLFPKARIARADLDTTVDRKRWQETVSCFYKRELDILVGTQTITKGYHFPGVTLVGILWADINLSLPLYNAAETTLQQIIQVAGRAGRQSNESLVVVQTLVQHPIFSHMDERQYTTFFDTEIVHRQRLGYPPCMRLSEIELRSKDEALLDEEAMRCASLLQEFKKDTAPLLVILGPAQPPVHKVKNIFMRKIYLKSPSFAVLKTALEMIFKSGLRVEVFITQNPTH
ncbi:MAG: Helicase PriA essential for oriC/DnaA-independent DNA replication [candidate division TM6 bacterium GW2011_GWF2_43_87]|nr:MAG: Helicase PriA essential for oriC/DnaA-independent DNA replication [candidate division TM6 bacterium GW2011_GWF2_43_87]